MVEIETLENTIKAQRQELKLNLRLRAAIHKREQRALKQKERTEKQQPHKCDVCGIFTTTFYNMAKHKLTKKHIAKENGTYGMKKVWTCDCGWQATDWSNFNRHTKTHLKKQPIEEIENVDLKIVEEIPKPENT
jgi:hypothetical protein